LKPSKKLILTPLAAIAASLISGHALAADPFVVKDIRVEGLQRVEPGTVFSYLPMTKVQMPFAHFITRAFLKMSKLNQKTKS
jgi:outer membrane protein assembly factor BamA